MKKIVICNTDDINDYNINFPSEHEAMLSLFEVIHFENYDDDIKNLCMNDRIETRGTDFTKKYDLNQIWIWPDYLVKQREWKKLETDAAIERHYGLYLDYFNRRWKEVPILKIFFDDFLALHKKFCELKKAKTKYIILTSYHFKDFDTVHIEGKEELSVQDLEYFKREHEYYLKCEKARQKYRDNHPDYSFDKWRGPQDNEFNEDWQKFLDQD